jgi:hypothetical protein
MSFGPKGCRAALCCGALVLVLLGLPGLATAVWGQTKGAEGAAEANKLTSQAYWVAFRGKPGSNLTDPQSYYNPAARARRRRLGVPLVTYTDLPVAPAYRDTLAAYARRVGTVSRWLNGAAAQLTPAAAAALRRKAFVQQVRPLEGCQPVLTRHSADPPEVEPATAAPPTPDDIPDSEMMDRLQSAQLGRMQVELFHERNLKGKGIRIAVFDGGFEGMRQTEALEHLYKQDRIIATRNFAGITANAYAATPHGTHVVSAIAGLDQRGQPLGAAPQAEFLLARTERLLFENRREELFWLEAVEWAERQGADLINSSLAYGGHNYFPEQLNGATALISRAANIAARKGVLTITAAGNEGKGPWEYITMPGDADSALTVGAINPHTDLRLEFSSSGPTIDGRVKPNVAAYGKCIVDGSSGRQINYGTSFASPLVTGFAACVLQRDSTLAPMELLQQLEEAGHLYPYFDYSHGYGIPQAGHILKAADTMPRKFELQRIDSTGTPQLKVCLKEAPPPDRRTYLFYHIARANGRLRKYAVLAADKQCVLSLPLAQGAAAAGATLRLHYEGYTDVYEFPPKAAPME